MPYGLGMSCPGDTGCPGYIPPAVNAAINDPNSSDADFWAGMDWLAAHASPNQAGSSQSFTQWLNANSGLALGVGGAFFGLVLLAKAGR